MTKPSTSSATTSTRRRALLRAIDVGAEDQRSEVDAYANLLIENSASSSSKETMSLLDIAAYYEKIADAPANLKMARAAFRLAEQEPDLNLQRRANNVLGVAYARNYDFSSSSFHLQESARLSAYQADPVFELASLSNIISLFDIMGLKRDADQLCELLLPECCLSSSESRGDALLKLQLQNAINGASLARGNGDIERAYTYVEMAERLAEGKTAPPIFKALLASIKAKIQADRGDIRGAADGINLAIEAGYASGNQQVKVALATAAASVASHGCSEEIFELNRVRLSKLVQDTIFFPSHTEGLLRASVKLCASRLDSKSLDAGELLLRRLSEHLIKHKHRHFYEQVGLLDIDSDVPIPKLRGPSYPKLCFGSRFPNVVQHFEHATNLVTNLIDECLDQSMFLCDSRRVLERVFRSEPYSIAENWSIAADLKAGGTGQHGRWVGDVAREISLRLGLTDSASTQIGLACRLHDIGKLVVDAHFLSEVFRGRVDEFFVLREHAIAGAFILSGHSDATLELGAMVAKSHHEWWNGFGGPMQLSGVDIPQAARICTIANACVEIMASAVRRTSSANSVLKQQLSAMSGVQLDPEMTGVILSDLVQLDCFGSVWKELQRESTNRAVTSAVAK